MIQHLEHPVVPKESFPNNVNYIYGSSLILGWYREALSKEVVLERDSPSLIREIATHACSTSLVAVLSAAGRVENLLQARSNLEES